MNEILGNCNHCGGKGVIRKTHIQCGHGDVRIGYFVECEDCLCRTPSIWKMDTQKAIDEVVHIWNKNYAKEELRLSVLQYIEEINRQTVNDSFCKNVPLEYCLEHGCLNCLATHLYNKIKEL